MPQIGSKLSTATFPEFADTTKRMVTMGPKLIEGIDGLVSLYLPCSIARGEGDRKVFMEMDGDEFARSKPEGTSVVKTDVVKGYEKTGFLKRFGAEIDITWEMREYGKDETIKRQLLNLSKFGPRRMMLDLQHRFTFAEATSYNNMDGETVDTSMGDTLAMASTVHTLTGSSDTYSTIVPGNPQFSMGSFEAAQEVANEQILNNLGRRRHMNFNTLVIHRDPVTMRKAYQLRDSMSDNTQNNSGVVNTYKGSFDILVLPDLATNADGSYNSAKAKQWHWVAKGEWEGYFQLYEAPHTVAPRGGSNLEDAHTDDWTFGMRTTYLICVVSAKGTVTSFGNNT